MGSVVFPTPCDACATPVLNKAREIEHTGSATGHCPHRSLGMVLTFEKGELTRYAFGPLNAEELEERNRLVKKYLHEEHGLQAVK